MLPTCFLIIMRMWIGKIVKRILKHNIMKTRPMILIFFVLIVTFSCKAQVVPVEDYYDYWDEDDGIPPYEFRDINDVFHPFLGNWTATYSQENYPSLTCELYIAEFSDNNDVGADFDILRIKYKVFSGDNLLIDTTGLPDENALVMQGLTFLPNKTSYRFSYGGENYGCGEFGDFRISVNNEGTELRGFLIQGLDMLFADGCPDGWDGHILPTEPVAFERM